MPSETPGIESVRGVLSGVIDPELGSDIVDLGMVKDIAVDTDGTVTVTIALTTAGCPLRAQIQKDVRTRVAGLPGVSSVTLKWTELDPDEKAAVMDRARRNIAERADGSLLPPTARAVMVASGKGGVGKSSITVNLAAGLAAEGFTVGVLDADIWGFSVPRMLGLDGRLSGEVGTGKITPLVEPVGTGVLKVVSMGFLVEDESASLNWRGLILNRAVRHFLEDVDWGDLDYLVIDMPPGTGDVQMGLAKMLPRADMVVVTTPARTAQSVAVRVGSMARSYYLRIAGVVENMTAFVNEQGTVYELFGSGGGAALADELGVPLLARVPIDAAVSAGGDDGTPTVLGTGPAAEALQALVRTIVDEAIPPVAMEGCTARLLDDVRDHIEGRAPTVTAVDFG